MSAGLEIAVRAPLRGFELRAELAAGAGERVAVMGPSGAGKTTLLRLAAGLLSPPRGRVALGEEPWLDTDAGIDLPPERRRCGYVFQDYALFPRMSAWRNVAYGIRGGQRRERRRRALELLARFGVADLADARPGELSGGERQRVALARALAPAPRALLLDEPLSALDPGTRRGALGELHGLLGELDVPVLLVTHDFDEAAVLGDRLAVLDRGVVLQEGTATEVSTRPGSPFVAELAGAAVLRGEAGDGGDGPTPVRLPGGGVVHSADRARGPVAVAVFPWEISVETGEPAPGRGSALNRLAGEVTSVTPVGDRVRIGIAVPEPLGAEVTGRSAADLDLRPGRRVTAAWKATATRLIPL